MGWRCRQAKGCGCQGGAHLIGMAIRNIALFFQPILSPIDRLRGSRRRRPQHALHAIYKPFVAIIGSRLVINPFVESVGPFRQPPWWPVQATPASNQLSPQSPEPLRYWPEFFARWPLICSRQWERLIPSRIHACANSGSRKGVHRFAFTYRHPAAPRNEGKSWKSSIKGSCTGSQMDHLSTFRRHSRVPPPSWRVGACSQMRLPPEI
jgi:hypothetical protein